MRVYTLKTDPGPFDKAVRGLKRFEWRDVSDWPFPPEVGDTVVLVEVDRGRATKRVLFVEITDVLMHQYGVPDGYAVMSFRRCCEASILETYQVDAGLWNRIFGRLAKARVLADAASKVSYFTFWTDDPKEGSQALIDLRNAATEFDSGSLGRLLSEMGRVG